MTFLIAMALAACSAYLMFPLYKIPQWPKEISFRRIPKITDEEILNFFIVFRLELESGELPIVALQRSLAVVSESHFAATREALVIGDDVI